MIVGAPFSHAVDLDPPYNIHKLLVEVVRIEQLEAFLLCTHTRLRTECRPLASGICTLTFRGISSVRASSLDIVLDRACSARLPLTTGSDPPVLMVGILLYLVPGRRVNPPVACRMKTMLNSSQINRLRTL